MDGGGNTAAALRRQATCGRAVLSRKDWQAVKAALQLSPRQFEVAQHLFDDLSEAQIAISLGISPHTVHTYIRQIYSKTSAGTRCEMLVAVFAEVLAAREGDEMGGSD